MKKKPHRILPLIFLLILPSVFGGCASDETSLKNAQDLARLETEVNHLKTEIQKTKAVSTSLEEQKYADLQSQMDALTSDLQALEAKSSDTLQRLNDIDQKIARLKKAIKAQGERIAKLESKAAAKRPPRKPLPVENDVTGTASTIESLYDDAYHSFTQGDFQTARKKFKHFLKRYPKSIYSDNATFWIGETYYAQGDFENAILEYERVRRKYPHGDKVPSALLKEGIAFIKLKDRTDGKLILRKLIKRYPRSDQARIARRILKKMR